MGAEYLRRGCPESENILETFYYTIFWFKLN